MSFEAMSAEASALAQTRAFRRNAPTRIGVNRELDAALRARSSTDCVLAHWCFSEKLPYAMNINFLAVLISFFALIAAGAEVHTWNFIRDGNLQSTESPGSLSFKKGGRFDGDFIRLSGTNDIVILGGLDGAEYLVGLTNLCTEDCDYVLKVKDSPVDEAKLQGEAAERVKQARARNAAIEEAQRAAVARRAQEQQAKEQAAAHEAAQRLVTFAPLQFGRPPYSSAEYLQYLLAKEAVAQAAQAENPTYANYARQILALSDDITGAKLNGLQNVVEIKANEIKRLLDLLFDANVL
jgi:hypothetical protein